MAGRHSGHVAGQAVGDLHALPPRAPRRGSRGGGHRLAAVGDLRRGREPAARAEGDHCRADETVMARPTPQARHSRGTFIVIVLGVIFIAIIAALIFTTGKKPAAQSSTPSEPLSVLPMRIRLRTEPTAKAPVVATATNGEKPTVLEDRGAWVKVQDEDGVAGWTERNSLERTSERERRLARYESIKKLPALSGIASERTPLYAGPGIFYPLIGELPRETQVKVYTRDHDFYAIDHDGAIAYADVDAIDVSSAGTRQLEVRTDTAAIPTETTASAPTQTATEEPAPTPAPQPAAPVPAEVPASADRTGVYAAVPAGGTHAAEGERG